MKQLNLETEVLTLPQENEWEAPIVEKNTTTKRVKNTFRILDWVYINIPKHSLDKRLAQITSIRKNRRTGVKEAWVTIPGKRVTDQKQILQVEKRQIKLCSDRKVITNMIQREWNCKSNQSNNNLSLHPSCKRRIQEEIKRKPDTDEETDNSTFGLELLDD